MRLLIATGIYPPDHGGPARFVPALADAAVARGWKVAVITLGDVETASIGGSEHPYRVLTVPRGWARPKRVSAVIRHLTQGLKGSDVLFANGLYEEVYLATRIVRRPWVAKVVGDPIWERARNSGAVVTSIEDFQEQGLGTTLRLQRAALTRALRAANLVVTPSAQLARILHHWGVPSPRIIHNGVAINAASQSRPEFDVVTVCRLVPWKGVDVLIRACVAEGLSLLIVGDGPQRADLELLASDLHAEGLITFTGSVDPADTPRLIESGRVFALNSSYEGMSFALLEARERAMPVVVGRNAGNESVVRSGVDGLVVDSGSEAEVREALSALMADPTMARDIGRAGRRDVIEKYSIDSTTRATLNALEGLVNA